MKKHLLLSLAVCLAFLCAMPAAAQFQIQVYSGADLVGPCNPFSMANPNPPTQYNASTGNYFACSPFVSGATAFAPLWTATGVPTGTTGSGNNVLSNSPTLVTAALGTPSAIVLTNATAFPPALVHLNVQKTLALTDLQTLNSVPYQVIAPPGATSMIQMGVCTLNLTRGSAAFTGGGTVSIGYDTTSTPATNGTIASTVFTTFASSHAVVVLPVAVAVTATTSLANKGVYITAAAADFASGTGATGQLNCDYSIVSGVA